jgi:hypothetical protein
MIVGPRVIFDKSFVQSLGVPLIDELTLYFTATCLPTLISEIVADLKRAPRSDGRIGEDLVRELATKMTAAHGAEPAPLRSLVVGNLHGQDVPMHGYTVPVLAGSRGVESNESGSQLIVSQIPQQELWARWAIGDFRTDDDVTAAAWRAAIEATDLEAERDRWAPFAAELGHPKSIEAVVEAVDRVMTDRNSMTQAAIINVALTIVRANQRARVSAANYFLALPKGTLLAQYAPFAAHAARLYLCFAVGLACRFIGTRATNTIDLQYLLYAPFCRVFVSLDKLHRMLWTAGAVTSDASFVWGSDLRSDLEERNARRIAMTFEEWAAHREVHGDWPEPIDGSPIYALWEKHCPNWPRGGGSPTVGKTIDDLDPRTRDLIRQAMAMARRR